MSDILIGQEHRHLKHQKTIIMITETIENGRSFSGEVYREEAPDVVLIDQLECEAISFSKVRKELNKEFKFCSHKVLVEYLSNLDNNY